jgi:hypothetical protein
MRYAGAKRGTVKNHRGGARHGAEHGAAHSFNFTGQRRGYYSRQKQAGVIEAGQSNTGTDGLAITPIVPDALYQTAMAGVFAYSNGEYETLKYTRNNHGTNFGPELTLCYDLRQAYPERTLFFDKVSQTGTGLFQEVGNDWNAYSVGELYDTFKGRVQAMRDRITQLGKEPVIIVNVMQGERDCLNSTTASAWGKNFIDIYMKLKSENIIVDYWIVNILNSTQSAGSTTDHLAVMYQQRKTIDDLNSKFRNVFAITLEEFTFGADVVHFDKPSMQGIGSKQALIVQQKIFPAGYEKETKYSAAANTALTKYSWLPAPVAKAIATYIDAEVTAGNWNSRTIELQLHAVHNPSSALIGLKGIASAVPFGGVAFDRGKGFSFDGVDDYLNTNFNPALDNNGLAQNNFAVGWYVHTNSSAGDVQLGGIFGNGSLRTNLAQSPSLTPDQETYRMNSTNGRNTSAEGIFANSSEYIVSRTGGTTVGLYKNGTSIDSTTTASTGLPDGKIFTGNLNNVGTPNPSTFFAGKIGAFIVIDPTGFDFATHYTNMSALMTTLNSL